MNGTIVKVNCNVGDVVNPDSVVLILDAMKMENEIYAGADGTVKEIRVSAGTAVQPGEVLIVLG